MSLLTIALAVFIGIYVVPLLLAGLVMLLARKEFWIVAALGAFMTWQSARADDFLDPLPGSYELHNQGNGLYTNPSNSSQWMDHGHEIQNLHTNDRLINHNNGVYSSDDGKTCTGIGGGRLYCY